MYSYSSLLTVLLAIIACAQLEAKKDMDPVTCGSVIKLTHKETVSFTVAILKRCHKMNIAPLRLPL